MPEFMTLAAWLRPEPAPAAPENSPEVSIEEEPRAEAEAPNEALIADVCARVRRFRAMLADALDRSIADLLREIAVDVVGRELLLTPADLEAIVRRACERCAQVPVTVHVHPSQQALCDFDVPVHSDPALRSDDVRIELRSGSIDARLGVRLEQMLARLGE